MAIRISAGLIKRKGQVVDLVDPLKPSHDQVVNSKLPEKWRTRVINFDRFNALLAQSPDVQQKVDQIAEGTVMVALEMDGKLQLLSVEEIEKLGDGLDEAAAVAQLTP